MGVTVRVAALLTAALVTAPLATISAVFGSAGVWLSAGALSVVGGAQESAVGDCGLATGGYLDDVVDLAVLGLDVAGGVATDAVWDLDGAAQGSGEEAGAAGDGDGLGGGVVEEDGFDVGFGEEAGDLEAGQDEPVEEVTDGAEQLTSGHHDGHRRARHLVSGAGSAGPPGHLNQRVGPALVWGAVHSVGTNVFALKLTGPGVVGFEQFLVDPFPGGVDLGAANPVEVGVEVPAVSDRANLAAPLGPLATFVGGHIVGVGGVEAFVVRCGLEEPDGSFEPRPIQILSRRDQLGLRASERLGPFGGGGAGEAGDVVCADLAGRPGVGHHRQGPYPPGGGHRGVGTGRAGANISGQAGPSGPGVVRSPQAPGIPASHMAGGDGIEP